MFPSGGLEGGAMSGLPVEFDYQFTDRELSDLLQYIQADPVDGGSSIPVPSFLPTEIAHAPALGLQFQPHREAPLHQRTPGPEVTTGQGPLPTFSRGVDLAGSATPPPEPQGGAGFARTPPPAHSGPHSKKESKGGTISHSTVEKQRRDRINSLIDELRELVPGNANSNAAHEGADSKRPKHVVLSDTIALVKELQGKAKSEDTGRADSGDHSDDHNMLVNLKSEDVSGSYLRSDVQGMSDSLGVFIEEKGDSCYIVRVTCKDRRGLLADLFNTLKSLPLEIRSATIQTKEGTVHDIFDVRWDSSDQPADPDEIRDTLNERLQDLMGSPQTGDKRRRF